MTNDTELNVTYVKHLHPWLTFLDEKASYYRAQIAAMPPPDAPGVILEEDGMAGAAPAATTSPGKAQEAGSDPISWLTDAAPIEVNPATIAPEEGPTPSGESTDVQAASTPVTNPPAGDDPALSLL